MIKEVANKDRGVTQAKRGRAAFSDADAASAIMEYFERGCPEAQTALLLYHRVFINNNELANSIIDTVTASLDADEIKTGDDTDGGFVLGLLYGMSVQQQ